MLSGQLFDQGVLHTIDILKFIDMDEIEAALPLRQTIRMHFKHFYRHQKQIIEVQKILGIAFIDVVSVNPCFFLFTKHISSQFDCPLGRDFRTFIIADVVQKVSHRIALAIDIEFF